MLRRLLVLLCTLLPGYVSAERPIETGDFNFDAHEDYRQQAAEPGNQCGWWEYYLYDPSLGEHRYVVTSFCRESFDPEKRQVTTFVSGGMVGRIYEKRRYRWHGFRLVTTYLERQDYDGTRDLFVRTTVSFDEPDRPVVRTELLTPEQVGAAQPEID